jgi:hypothetical protein
MQQALGRRRLFFVFLLLLSAALGVVRATGAELRWQSPATGRELLLKVTPPVGPTTVAPAVVFYLKNLAAERVGLEDDESILRAFAEQKYLLIEVDYAGHPAAKIPTINRDLFKLRDDLRGGRLLQEYRFNQARVFLVPAGCRVLTDQVFYQDGPRTLGMDIIYPSKPKRPVGAVLEFSCDNANRMGNSSLAVCSDTILDGAAVAGFAAAMADHPVAAPYKGLDPMPDSAWKIKAAVRTLRARGAELGLDGRIVPAGFSRGSGMALMLVTTAGLQALDGAGPHAEESSAVQGAVVMSGRFSYVDLLPDDQMMPRYTKWWGDRSARADVWAKHGALEYLKSAPDVPLFLSINISEGREAQHHMEVLRKRLAELGAKHEFRLDREPRGHKVPLDPDILAAMYAYLGAQLR